MHAIEFLPSAKKELSQLDRLIQKQLKEKIILLAIDPDRLKNNIKALKGECSGKFRLRVRDYRIIFRITEEKILITIIRIGHRKEVY
ncbi:type II toxin-antitoxin system RelE/ParE family toxin [Sulfuricurvum sp.]|uniref:type II toxin-antitoxin system RelE family toxin n=1 Tax=Sulfuricurvum sp. TaxID=2025608 RepID=UPI0019B4774C|nr:type II toxin-antitoxin system RelE/ParE family toxin [Sulfuricurvum sp.]MBD3799076.1 type II toxin-antitoxin system RelE/ParE family toxin [Campylobacterota bacterium]MBD3806442.1 type II toxin-antitoxin system RelE/ParE family toxin [Sulfuricurvum sp.]